MKHLFLTILSLFLLFALAPARASAATIGKSVSQGSLNQGLVGWWTMDGQDCGASYCLDKSGSNYTLTQATVADRPTNAIGKIGQTKKFDGTSDFFSTSFTTITTSSVFAWIKTTGGGERYAVDNSSRGVLGTFNNKALVYCGGTAYSGTSVINDNKWHLIGFVNNGITSTIYVDGVAENSITKTCNFGGATLTIGRNVGGVGQQWQGSIDDVRIYNRALSATEIKQLYQMGGGKISSSLTSATSNPLKTGLVGWWTFDGADVNATQVLDKSGQANHGTRNGGVAMGSGKIGQGGKFDGINDYVGKTDFNASQINTGSVAVWFKATPGQITNARLFEIGTLTGTDNRVRVVFNGVDKPQPVLVKNNVTLYNSATPLAYGDNKWHLFALSWSSESLKVYVDGVAVNTASGDYSLNLGSSVKMYISEYIDGAGYNFKGSMDDFRVYNRVLSLAEIKQLYQMGGGKISSSLTSATSNPLKTGLVGWWTFDGADVNATQVLDKSGQGKHGTRNSVLMTSGKIGQAGKFNRGVNDKVSFASPITYSASTTWSYSLWIKKIETAGFYTGDDYGGFLFDYPATTHAYRSAGGVAYFIFTTSPALNKWTHLVWTADTNDNVSLYENGVFKQKTNVGSSATTFNNFGNSYSGGGQGAKMYMDDVRIYNRVLSATEIKQLYQMGK